VDNIRLDLGVVWTGLVWLRIETGGELLWIRYWTFGFHKMLGASRVPKQLGISWVVLSCMELVRLSPSSVYTLQWNPILCSSVKGFLSFNINFSDSRSTITVLAFLQLRFSLVWCPNLCFPDGNFLSGN
jgi:hypothetical protein